MPIFACEQCHVVENTARSGYWMRGGGPALCSQCDPRIRKWHDRFPRCSAAGYWLGSDGFLYHQDDKDSGRLKWREEHQGFRFVKQLTEEA